MDNPATVEQKISAVEREVDYFQKAINGADTLIKSSSRPWIAVLVAMAFVVGCILLAWNSSTKRHMDTIDRLTAQVAQLEEQIAGLDQE